MATLFQAKLQARFGFKNNATASLASTRHESGKNNANVIKTSNPNTDSSPHNEFSSSDSSSALAHATPSAHSLSNSDDRASDRVIKRRRQFFLPKPSVEIPTFRVIDENNDDDDDDEMNKQLSLPAPPATKQPEIGAKKRKQEFLETSAATLNTPLSREEEEEHEVEEEEEEQSENISLYSDEVSAVEFAPATEIEKEPEEPAKKKRRKNDGTAVTDKQALPRAVASGQTVKKAPLAEAPATESRIHRRPGSHATSSYTEMSDRWEYYARFQQTMVPNLIRTARIVTNAAKQVNADTNDEEMADAEEDETDICMSKQAIPIFEKYLSTRFSQIMDAAAQTYAHRGMERMTPNDVRLAIHLNPTFAQFDIERFLNGNRNLAPALLAFMDQLKVGKTQAKTQRCVFQHTDLRGPEKQ